MNNIEQNLINNNENIIKNNEDVNTATSVEVSRVENKPTEEEINKKKVENDKKIEEIRENVLRQFGGQESKEGFPPNHILNPGALDKIAQLEGIDTEDKDFKFNPNKYQTFLEYTKKAGEMSVEGNQKRLKDILEKKGKIKDYNYTDTYIVGTAGWNRYGADANGTLTLRRGKDISSKNEEYNKVLEAKARELGFIVG